MTKRMNRDKRALSPVIATVILISVTIVVAVSVAYWMGAIAGGYTSFEQIELPSIYAKWQQSTSDWNITIELKNSGSADATVDNIYVNGIPLKDYDSGIVVLQYDTITLDNSTGLASISIKVSKGSSKTIYLTLDESEDDGFTSGTRIEIKVHTAAGKDYPTSVKLP
ncbi:type IV pilin [Candidatus Bathyarchaeota archaeon]|nr:type IV pilin [Candidatus Bathyarchaeota archaeon]